MKVSKREKSLLLVVLLLAIVCAYYLLFLKPYLSEMSELTIQKANSETRVQTYTQLKNNVDIINEQIEEKKLEIVEYSDDILIGIDQPPILVYLEKAVGRYAQKNMFIFGPPEYSGQMSSSPVQVTMLTTYDGLKGFIEEITNSEYIINVSNIQAVVASTSQPDSLTEEEVGDTSDNEPEKVNTGVPAIDNTDNLLEVTLELNVYSMYGEAPSDKVYPFDNKSYNYGGDIFY